MAKFNRDAAKKAGYTDEQIDQYLMNSGGKPQQQSAQETPAIQIIQQRLQELSQPQQGQQTQQPQGDFMNKLMQSRALPVAGGVAGSIAGNVGGPVGRIAGASTLAGAGEQISQMAQGKPGDIPAALSANPLMAMINAAPHAMSQLKGEEPKYSSVEKAQRSAASAQGVGETAGFFFKLLKPGTLGKMLNEMTEFASKQSGGKTVPVSVIKERFLKETVPEVMKRAFREPTDKGTMKILEEIGSDTPRALQVAGKESLNYFRKKFNSIGGPGKEAVELLSNGIAKIFKEEQIKRAPAAAATIPLEAARKEILHMMSSFWPTRMALMATDFARKQAANIFTPLLKYGGAQVLGGATKNNEK